jgi:nitrogen fixation/metabolism regulation signal transduction histidine kinase
VSRLRTRLALLFALLTLLPWAVFAPFAARDLGETLRSELDRRDESSRTAILEALTRAEREAQRSVEELAGSVAMETFAKSLLEKTPPQELAATAEPLMRARGLSVLALLDARGVTLSSGHVPARAGDPDPVLFELTKHPEAFATVALVEVRAEEVMTQEPAFVVARPVDFGELRIWVVGGVVLDDAFADHLSRLTGSEVAFFARTLRIAHAGRAPAPTTLQTLALSPDVSVQLVSSRATQRAALWGLGRALMGVVLLGLWLSIVLGVLLARYVTRPLEALAKGAQAVARGAWDTRVMTSAKGELGELVGAFNAMTEELERTTERVVSAERVAAWQEIAKRLAHELKNPLTPIRMSLETLLAAHRQGEGRMDALFAQSAGPMLEEVDRLRRTVDAFSSFARLPKPEMAPMDLSEWAKQVVSLQSQGWTHVSAKTELEPGLTVEADRDQLTQVLVNLLKNAAEAMPHGGAVTVTTRRVGKEAMLEVRDTGPGIPMDARAQLFTPYFTTKASGTGLGLAVSARICQEHDGSLQLLHDGPGGAFRVTLPTRA